MPKQNNYQKLKKIWYKKLQDSGFNDIESMDYPDGDLRSNRTTHVFIGTTNTTAAREEYYALARQFLNEHGFSSLLHKNIWMYHSEAVSYRDIAIILKKAGLGLYSKKYDMIKPLTWHNVRRIVSLYRDIMKKEYVSL